MKIKLPNHWQIATIETITAALGTFWLWAFPMSKWETAFGAFVVLWALMSGVGNLAIHVNRHGWFPRPKNPDGFGTVDEEEQKWRKMLEKP